jgi:hypothetical protein
MLAIAMLNAEQSESNKLILATMAVEYISKGALEMFPGWGIPTTRE